MLGGPLGAALHYFPLQWGVEQDPEQAKAVNIGGDAQVPEEDVVKTDGHANGHANGHADGQV